MRTTSKTVPVGDIEVACTIVGEGTPLVVLHGAIGLGSTYMRALDPWGNELQLIHYNQRGSGNTPVGDVQRVSFAGGVEDLELLRQGRAWDPSRFSGTRPAPTWLRCTPPSTPRRQRLWCFSTRGRPWRRT